MVQDIFVSGLGGSSGFEELSGSVELSGLEELPGLEELSGLGVVDVPLPEPLEGSLPPDGDVLSGFSSTGLMTSGTTFRLVSTDFTSSAEQNISSSQPSMHSSAKELKARRSRFCTESSCPT